MVRRTSTAVPTVGSLTSEKVEMVLAAAAGGTTSREARQAAVSRTARSFFMRFIRLSPLVSAQGLHRLEPGGFGGGV